MKDEQRLRDEYAANMRAHCPQFQHFGIPPLWRPGEKDIYGFCHDEVVRQMHDPRVHDDGGVRLNGMFTAWMYADGLAAVGTKPIVPDIRNIGAYVEKINKTGSPYVSPDTGFRVDNVWIAQRKAVHPIKLKEFVEALVRQVPAVTPGPGRMTLFRAYNAEEFTQQVMNVETVDDWYLAYEWIHPWPDGNGRSGKVLHNWLNGTLADPVLVPDYFGGGNP